MYFSTFAKHKKNKLAMSITLNRNLKEGIEPSYMNTSSKEQKSKKQNNSKKELNTSESLFTCSSYSIEEEF